MNSKILAEMEAERARIAKPAKKAGKDGWIRNRGRTLKCPVHDDDLVDYVMRDGSVMTGHPGKFRAWKHYKEPSDIMRYRLHKPAEQDQSELRKKAIEEAVGLARFKPAEQPTKSISDLPVIKMESGSEIQYRVSEDQIRSFKPAINPIEWRDRIHEIDRTVEALEEERVSLIQRLADEGLKLIDKINEGIADAKRAHSDALVEAGKQFYEKPAEVRTLEQWQLSALTDGKFVQAIKEYRNLYGSGLKEAKQAVEQYRDAHRQSV